MAPRKGVFISNKVNPGGNFRNVNKKNKGFTNQKEKGDFFITPASSGSTVRDVHVEKRKNSEISVTNKEKKPFDKKKWRMQRYSKKYKVQQWENKRKKAVLREYYKQIDDRPKFDVQKIYAEEEIKPNEENEQGMRGDNNQVISSNNQAKNKDDNSLCIGNDVSFKEETQEEIVPGGKSSERKDFNKNKGRKKAHEEFQRITEEKKKLREEAQRKKVEKQAAVKKNKEERLAKFKRLNKKTKKGQPIMKERLELLLEQIQRNLNK